MMKLKQKQILMGLFLLGSTTSVVFAQGILLNDSELRNDLNWLNQQGVIQISTSTWPLSGDEIQKALSNAKPKNSVQEKVIASIQKNINLDNNAVKN